MAEFIYNNTKNVSTGYTLSKLNCGYHCKVLFEDDIDLCSKFYFANKLAKELR